MFHNILVAVDGSLDADAALAHAIDLAESEHSRLTLITGVAELPPAAYLMAGGDTGHLLENARAQAEAIFRQARDRVPDDLPVTTVLTDQPIRTALIGQIKKGHHDLVVMGSRGRGAVRAALLGSASHYVRPAPQPRPRADRPRRSAATGPNRCDRRSGVARGPSLEDERERNEPNAL